MHTIMTRKSFSRLEVLVLSASAVIALPSSLWMLMAPYSWYQNFPGRNPEFDLGNFDTSYKGPSTSRVKRAAQSPRSPRVQGLQVWKNFFASLWYASLADFDQDLPAAFSMRLDRAPMENPTTGYPSANISKTIGKSLKIPSP